MSSIKTMSDIEEENLQYRNIISLQQWKDQRYNDVEMDCGFMLDSEIAKDILRCVAPEKLDIDAAGFLLINDMYDASIVGVDGDGKGLFTVNLPKEIADYNGDTINMQKTLDFYTNIAKKYKRLRKGGIILAVTVGVALLLLALSIVNLLYIDYKVVLFGILGFGVFKIALSVSNKI